MAITVTDIAWKKIQEKLSKKEYKNIRIILNAKGCGGSSYSFKPTNDEPDENEFYLEKNGNKVIIDEKIQNLLIGGTMDWVKRDDFNEGFDIINPNELGRCGCGESVILN